MILISVSSVLLWVSNCFLGRTLSCHVPFGCSFYLCSCAGYLSCGVVVSVFMIGCCCLFVRILWLILLSFYFGILPDLALPCFSLRAVCVVVLPFLCVSVWFRWDFWPGNVWLVVMTFTVNDVVYVFSTRVKDRHGVSATWTHAMTSCQYYILYYFVVLTNVRVL